jgi:hypothetical protein
MKIWRYGDILSRTEQPNDTTGTPVQPVSEEYPIGHQKGRIRKVKLSLSASGVELWLQAIRILALDGGECSSSRVGRFFTEGGDQTIIE